MASRLSPPDPPGLLLKCSAPVKKRRLKLGRQPREKDDNHLNAIRMLPCSVCGLEGSTQAAHIRFADAEAGKKTGIGERPSDRWCVPLCEPHHREQYKGNERVFWESYGIDALKLASSLYKVSPQNDGMRAIVALFLASRIVGEDT